MKQGHRFGQMYHFLAVHEVPKRRPSKKCVSHYFALISSGI